MKSLKNIQNLKNKKVLARVDFNAPVGDDGVMDSKEDWRIRAALPTIKYLLENKARIILMSHLGRPGTNQESIKSRIHKVKSRKYSLKPAAKRLEKLLNHKVKFVEDQVSFYFHQLQLHQLIP